MHSLGMRTPGRHDQIYTCCSDAHKVEAVLLGAVRAAHVRQVAAANVLHDPAPCTAMPECCKSTKN